jgi:hypothetical protein
LLHSYVGNSRNSATESVTSPFSVVPWRLQHWIARLADGSCRKGLGRRHNGSYFTRSRTGLVKKEIRLFISRGYIYIP